MKIRIPATSANLGPGFDSIGLALSRYLTIEVLKPADEWYIEHNLPYVPDDKYNLLIKTALKIKPDLQPHHLKMESDIPLARGLGSSSSVIVAGIELANQLGNLQLSQAEKLQLATEIEGHPDNVAPAIYGNLVVASYVNKRVSAIVSDFPECAFLAFIPKYELRTSDSRGVLPNQLSHKKAVAASAVSNVLVAALLKGDLTTAGQAMESDIFHEPFRQRLVKEFYAIKKIGHEYGAYATYLSGAGPTIMVLAPQDKIDSLQEAISQLGFDGELAPLTVDTVGIYVE
ncbi:homoserine kinase [Streptococcus ovuberis]|uniref:Homoserine kinase n=1 Tax=Streptococcus ovuberis TaxID=1936207 RepID=A0A7X6N1I4_9STRE|nr:homoserine kinase [Streptococcus ovuberis]NKZ20497.1 homoserine kinase [Streptococcus ovuberis]